MKKIVIISWLFLLAMGCDTEEFLDRPPTNQLIGSEELLADPAFVEGLLNNIVGKLPFYHATNQFGESNGGTNYWVEFHNITDEARQKSEWASVLVLYPGLIDPTTGFGGLTAWGDFYSYISLTNEFLVTMEGSTLAEPKRSIAIARAKFCRAHFYFDLARRFGNIPIDTLREQVTDSINTGFIPQSKQAEVYDWISSELSSIEGIIPNKSETAIGEINNQAVIALNAKVLLYAQRWAEAAGMADKLISGDQGDGIDLFQPNPSSASVAVENLRELYTSHGGNTETILERTFNRNIRAHSFGRINWPLRWRSDWGGQCNPTQQMVDSYQMQTTGLSITDPTSAYDPDQPYTNRDPRFDATIYYHGAPGPEGVQPSTGPAFIDMEWNKNNEGPGDNPDPNSSKTGYYLSKFVDPGDGFYPAFDISDVSSQLIRFADVLLMYAEAANEAEGPTALVYDAINRVRRRAAMPELTPGLSQDQMREAIIQERKIELAFEGHRWFDLIRWRKAVEVLDGFIPRGVRIERKPTAPTIAEQEYLFDQSQFTYTYFERTDRSQVFPERMYLMPIPQGELDKFPGQYDQNDGY